VIKEVLQVSEKGGLSFIKNHFWNNWVFKAWGRKELSFHLYKNNFPWLTYLKIKMYQWQCRRKPRKMFYASGICGSGMSTGGGFLSKTGNSKNQGKWRNSCLCKYLKFSLRDNKQGQKTKNGLWEVFESQMSDKWVRHMLHKWNSNNRRPSWENRQRTKVVISQKEILMLTDTWKQSPVHNEQGSTQCIYQLTGFHPKGDKRVWKMSRGTRWARQ
jgi:hypothetical protein